MAKVRIPINPMQVGRVGAYTMYVRDGVQITRQRQNASNYGESASRSYEQQLRRVKWSNLVALYRVMAYWQPKAYEALEKGQTIYNKFMSINIDKNVVSFTKSESAAGAVVVEPVVVSQGSLRAVSAGEDGELDLGGLWESGQAPTTVGALAANLVQYNSGVEAGDNIAFVTFFNEKDATGIPRASCTYLEFTLDTNDSTPLADHPLGKFIQLGGTGGISVNVGAISPGDEPIAWVAVHTRDTSTGLKVSTERIFMGSSDLVEEYSTAEQLQLAVESYGVTQRALLYPDGSVPSSPNP